MSAPVVLFDVDGTLTDTSYLHTLAWRRAFLDRGHDVASWRIHRLIGASAIAVRSGGWGHEELVQAGAVEVHEDVAAIVAELETTALGDLLSG